VGFLTAGAFSSWKKKTLGKRRTRELEEKTIMEKTTREIKCGEEATISF